MLITNFVKIYQVSIFLSSAAYSNRDRHFVKTPFWAQGTPKRICPLEFNHPLCTITILSLFCTIFEKVKHYLNTLIGLIIFMKLIGFIIIKKTGPFCKKSYSKSNLNKFSSFINKVALGHFMRNIF